MPAEAASLGASAWASQQEPMQAQPLPNYISNYSSSTMQVNDELQQALHALVVPDHWCTIAYHELDTQVHS